MRHPLIVAASARRYCTASAMCGVSVVGDPARSAIVRATFIARCVDRALQPSLAAATFRNFDALSPSPACVSISFPCNAMLALPCRCTPDQVIRYQGKLSGPLLDRIDLHVEVPTIPSSELLDAPAGEETAAIRARCETARDVAMQRQGKANMALQGKEIDAHAGLGESASKFLNVAAAKLGWSARSTHRAMKVARTIADLAGSPTTETPHIAEAVQYRRALAATIAG
ncbi:MAG: ATP-binding protein [Ramlibacter sp.]|nr:ATP-binding protein [Ramlibacter sp.]